MDSNIQLRHSNGGKTLIAVHIRFKGFNQHFELDMEKEWDQLESP